MRIRGVGRAFVGHSATAELAIAVDDMVFDPGERLAMDVEEKRDRAAAGGEELKPAFELAFKFPVGGAILFVGRAVRAAHERLFTGEVSKDVPLEKIDQFDNPFAAGSGFEFSLQRVEFGEKFAVLGVDQLVAGFMAWAPICHLRGDGTG